MISDITKLAPGLFLTALIATGAILLAGLPALQSLGLGANVLGILLGLLVANLLQLPAASQTGIVFSTKTILRVAIILLGFKITLFDIFSIGAAGFFVDIFMVASTALLGIYVGMRLLKLDADTSILISAGSSICGASAVLATEGTLRSKPYKAAVAVGIVTVFGTVMMFLLPVLQSTGVLGFSEQSFGIYVGAATHEVAQAVAGGFAVSDEAGEAAVIAKLLRVVLLIPFLLAVAWWIQRDKSLHHAPIPFPWFVLGFVVVSLLYTFVPLPDAAVSTIVSVDNFLLAMAMTALGLKTKYSELTHVGWLPIVLGAVLCAWLIVGGFGAVYVADLLTSAAG